ncbi:hypothetical protein [Dictyoglomus thermophilum]|uniref:hypothetical protein n=1 Tax=Dictyoglomus thermophilum TaxID=14 RepID=UPI0016546AFE|nr:hypothetical protein [Dictyoglomus thermophilum]
MNRIKKDEVRHFIPYHRSYRKFNYTIKSIILIFLTIVLPLEIITLSFYPKITLFMCEFTKSSLAHFQDIKIVKSENGMFKNIYLLDIAGKYPSLIFSIIIFFLSLFGIFISKFIKAKPIQLWIIFIFFLILISSIFFILFPSRFPYDIKTFSELYMNTQIGTWITVPIIMGMALAPIPYTSISKSIIIIITFLYSLIFGVIRYTFFIHILLRFTYIFSLPLYFTLGPFIDFTYIVGFYSFYSGIIANKLQKIRETWKWVY